MGQMHPSISTATVGNFVVAAILLCFFSFCVYLVNSRVNFNPKYLPPGPKPHWLWGNKIQPPYPWRTMEGWTKQYGPLFTLWQGSTPMIVIGTVQAAKDILEKMSGITADRAPSWTAANIASGGMRTLVMRRDERWRKFRKMLHEQMSPKMAATYEPIQTAAVKTHILDILEQPDEHQNHAKKYAASVIMTITYGKDTTTSYTDPEVVAINDCLYQLMLCLRPPPAGFWVNYFPIMKYLPSFGWRSTLQHYHKVELELFTRMMNEARERIGHGNIGRCFATDAWEKMAEVGLNEKEIAYAGGSMFGAGSDTTAAAISIAIMAAACFPKKQAKLQDELDRVVGRGRCPTFEDRPELPYTEAFVREAFRWRPVSSGGFAHAVTEPFSYGGYHIPASAAILGNHWAITRDKSVYPDPDNFLPERFLKADERELNDLPHFTYGFGRRICAGKEIANRSLFLNVAMLLWAFEIRKKIDPSTQEEIPIDTLAFTDTANSHPQPFQVSFQGRIPQDVIEREMKM
ncbi:cytochrome P450 [Atractiella rhizophila]|nr:cytochrome P450 [Atractiella rhizophila]